MNLAALETMEEELRNLERQLSDPDVIADQNRFRDVSKRHAELSTAVGR